MKKKKKTSFISDKEGITRLENLCVNMGIESEFFVGLWIPVDKIIRFEDQPRRVFPEENISTMSESMKDESGSSNEENIETPIKVTPVNTPGGPMFKLIDGETRWLSAKKAELNTVPALVQFDLTHKEILKKSILANNCRFELSLIEQAGSYQALMKEFDWTQEEVAKKVGRHPVHVSNALKILRLHQQIQDDVLYGKIDAGYVLGMASWEKNHQLILYEALKKELKTFGRIPIQKVHWIIRKSAEEKGLKPIKTNRGKTVKPLSVILTNSILRRLKSVIEILDELRNLTEEQLAVTDKETVENIYSLLSQTEEDCEDTKTFLKENLAVRLAEIN